MTIEEAKELPADEQEQINESLVSRMREQLGDAVKIYSDCIDRLEKMQDELPELEKLFPDFNNWMETAEMADPTFYTELLETLVKLLPQLQQYVAEHPGCSMYEIVSRDELLDGKFRTDGPLADSSLLPEIPTILPADSVLGTDYKMLNDPLINKLTECAVKGKPIINTGAFDLNIGGKETAYTIVSMDDENVKIYSSSFDGEDRCIYNSYCSLIKSGSRYITAAMVWRKMSNKTETEHPTSKQAKNIMTRLKKFMMINAKVNLTEEYKRQLKRKEGKAAVDALKADFSYTLEGQLITNQIIEVTAGGTTVEAFAVREGDRKPLLLEYSELRDYIISVPAECMSIYKVTGYNNGKAKLDYNCALRSNSRRQIIKEYLIRRIGIMKHDARIAKHQQENKILLSSLYEQANINQDKRKERDAAREYAVTVLDNLQCNKLLTGYSIHKQGNAVRAFEIFL